MCESAEFEELAIKVKQSDLFSRWVLSMYDEKSIPCRVDMENAIVQRFGVPLEVAGGVVVFLEAEDPDLPELKECF